VISTSFRNTAIRGYRWNKGAPVRALVVHGFESSVVNFETYVAALVKKGYEVLAFDAPAHGKSAGKRMHVLDYRDFLHFVQQEFGPATRFVAHSVGALALCLCIAETPDNRHMRLALIAPLTETTSTFRLFSEFLQLAPAVRKELDQIILSISGHNLQWFSVSRALAGIRSEVLWHHDRTDLITPFSDLAPVIASNHPNVDFVFTEGLGHRRIYRDEKVITRIIEFL
ncbi:MAG: alpha/beta fold hydrolase, partial [Chitinophagaceae bacterium]